MIPRLCFITDAGAPLSIAAQAEAAARGGAKWVQLRHKSLPDDTFAELARALMVQLDALGATLIINDRVEVARAIGAAGLHIGQSDGDPVAVRDRIGPEMILGLSIEEDGQVADVPRGVDYLGVGPIRATGSKLDHAPPMGFDGLARAVAAAPVPCMAIGGLGVEDVPAVAQTGCEGIAIVSAISRSDNAEAAARAFVEKWRVG